jgi:hypothetical protein
MSAYGPKADQLGASATGPNMAYVRETIAEIKALKKASIT